MSGIAGRDAPILTVSVAAELAGMHAQTVRQYDRLGLVPAKRTRGGGRRYSLSDVDKLLDIQELSQKEGINLAGISRILELQEENEQLRRQNARLRKRATNLQEHIEYRQLLDQRVFAAGSDGDLIVFKRAQELREHRARIRTVNAEKSAEDSQYSELLPYPDVSAELVVWRPLLPRHRVED